MYDICTPKQIEEFSIVSDLYNINWDGSVDANFDIGQMHMLQEAVKMLTIKLRRDLSSFRVREVVQGLQYDTEMKRSIEDISVHLHSAEDLLEFLEEINEKNNM